jgi:hypothetical protein
LGVRGPNGIRRHRRIILGSTEQIEEEFATRKAIATLQIDINQNDIRMKNKPITVVDVYNHFRQRELSTRNILENIFNPERI